MQSSTGQTSEQRLQPTQSSSRTFGTGLCGTRPGPRPTFSSSGDLRSMHWWAPSSQAM
jgi:hypothetical protein